MIEDLAPPVSRVVHTAPRPTGARTALPASSRIAALATYLPAAVMSNDELSGLVQTSDEWIVQRTGVRDRRVAGPDEFTSDLCIGAVRQLVEREHAVLDDVDYVIVCTSTPDYVFPSCAALVQRHFGIPATGAFDLSAACAGFAYGLNVAHALVASGTSKKTLLIGAETMSKAIDYTDRSTCVLFGDGAGAALIEPADDRSRVLATSAGSDGQAGKFLFRTGLRNEIGGVHEPTAYLRQSGRDVYRWVMTHVPGAIDGLLARAGLTVAEIDWFVPHSANLRIIEGLCERTGIPLERALTSVERCGNTSAASIPLALSAADAEGKLRRGDRILMIGFGGGVAHAGAVLAW